MAEADRTCPFPGCERIRTSKGLCKAHQRQQREGRPLRPLRTYEDQPCSFEGCGAPARTKRLCPAHYGQLRKGETLRPKGNRAWDGAFKGCHVDGCDRAHRSRGYCNTHYTQYSRGNLPAVPVPARPLCAVDGCARFAARKSHCEAHNRQARAGQDPEALRAVVRGCSFAGCINAHDSRGLCSSHVKQRNSGLPLTPLRNVRPRVWSPWAIQGTGYVARWRSVNGVREFELQHRSVMEESIGRKLTSDESVHHLNGDRSDNRIENLELWSRFQPAGQRVEDKIAWARELLQRYASADPASE